MNPATLRIVPESNRADFITSTDMQQLALGRAGELARHKRSRSSPNLDRVFKVQLGKHTEDFHALWHFKTVVDCGNKLLRVNGMRRPNDDRMLPPWVAASFDYYLEAPDVVLELKHTNARASFREKAVYYMPQLQWQMLVTGADKCRFSCILGNDEPVWGEVDADWVAQEMLLEKATIFRARLLSGEEILDDDRPDAALASAAKAVKIDGTRAYDWTRDNQWCALSAQLVVARHLGSKAKEIETRIKALIPADASEVTGTIVSYKRIKGGALRVSIDADADKAAEITADMILANLLPKEEEASA